MKKTIALTGVSGAMGGEVLLALMKADERFNVRCILRNKPAFVKKILKKYGDRIFAFKGDVFVYEDCVKLIEGADYVINCASLIPPKADHNPDGAYRANYIGTKNLVDAILASGRENEIAYVHISTVAVYGNRAYPHIWGRVGDPVIISDYDVYGLNKLKAEKYVLESGLPRFVCLRQTGILHKYMFKNNLKDGLMFHTTWNGALEWVTDGDSGRMCANIVKYDCERSLDGFWNRIYNVGGGKDCRYTGFEVMDRCFRLIAIGKNGGVRKYFKPNWNATRNFHGMWFYDSDELENFLHFRSETVEDFWIKTGKKHRYFKLGGLIPAPLLSKIVLKRLFKNNNSPVYWAKHGKEGRVKAFFGGREKYESLPKNWKDFPLLCEGKTEDGKEIDYRALKDADNSAPLLLDHGYDENKPLSELGLCDLSEAAEFRGGKCLAKHYEKGKLFEKVLWKCREGHEFTLTPYTVLKGGYWCPHCCEPKPWKYGAIADIPFYGQVYFDSHDESEINDVYPLSEHEDDFIKI